MAYAVEVRVTGRVCLDPVAHVRPCHGAFLTLSQCL